MMMTEQLAPAHIPPGQRVYAIGDVHGCADQLEELYALIRRDIAARPGPAITLIHLGDYIDRGPDSAGVVARIQRPFGAAETINLTGNHEDLFLAALAGDRSAVELWMNNGGGETLASWGVPPRTRPRDWATHIPPAQIAALRALKLHYSIGGYFFVHAGIRPAIALADQTRQDLLWIRDPFLRFAGPLPAVIVHGHTPVDTPTLRPNRIGIDTGAVLGGPLTCLVLEGNRLGFLQV